MTLRLRAAAGLASCAILLALFAPPQGEAYADVPAEKSGPVTTEEALAQARQTGQPVVASALTDERTLVTADPETGLLRAELTAGVARVRDGQGGWREPSTRLVVGADGRLRPEAAVADYSVSAGGTADLVQVAAAQGAMSWRWPAELPPATVADDTATYPEVMPGVDLVVRAGLEQVESFLVVKSRQAAANPAVRQFALTANYEGVSPVELANGSVELRTPDGQPQILIPPARMWDSKGAEQGRTSAEAVEEATMAASSDVRLDASAITSKLTVAADVALLDNPNTVYPVVIDPTAQPLTRSYVVRVTQNFVTINDMSVPGKVGYNGWTAPYYKSRMFYQFRWPTNASGAPFNDKQIVKGEFQYVQIHSPQHSPCESGSSAYGPAVKVKLYNSINSDTDWPGPGAHEWSPVSDTYAVGHEDYCHDRQRQTWNITGMLQNERGNSAYSGRTTMTVGVYSADEADPMGWRHFDNESSGTYASPKLVLDYEAEPPAPTALTMTGQVSTSPLVTNSSEPYLRVTPSLEAGFTCRTTTDCLQAEFTVKSAGNIVVLPATLSNRVSAQSTTPAQVSVSGLSNGDYYALVRALNVDTGLYSMTATRFDFTVDLPPDAPGWSWVIPAGWTNPNALPAGQPLELQVSPAPGDPAVDFCVTIIRDGETTDLPCAAPVAGRISIGMVSPGVALVKVTARDTRGSMSPSTPDSPTERTFTFSS